MSTPSNHARPAASIVVGIGASAGGLRPLQQFLEHLPYGSGAAFVVVQHLSPDFKSLMKELLSRHTKMAIHRIEDRMAPEPDSVYLIPPKKTLTFSDGLIRVHERLGDNHHPNFPIDRFFESLAESLGERAIGVILSGTGSDGTRGIRSINDAGGIVLVQDPSTAQFDGMPQSAIRTGLTHYIQAPDELARTIFELVNRFDPLDPDSPLVQALSDDAVLTQITGILSAKVGVDFSSYKPSTLARRISRRISITGSDSADAYIRLLATSDDEREALRNDVLIGVTRFFRDPDAWRVLEDRIIAPGLRDAEARGVYRAWVTGCSTGEEVYSLATLIHRQKSLLDVNVEIKVFATDIERRSLEFAAQGAYQGSVADDIPPETLSRYFVRQGDELRISRDVRSSIIFAEHNVTRDAPFTQMDIVTCRNVLIYMQTHLQQQILSMLHSALRVGGTLFLGAAETLGPLDSEFTAIDRQHKIWSKRRDVALPFHRPRASLFEPVVPHRSSDRGISRFPSIDQLEAGIRVILERERAALLIIGADNGLLHAIGNVSRFLQIPEGERTADVYRMMPESLALPLSTAVHRARRTDEAVAASVQLNLDSNAAAIDFFCQKGDGGEENGIILVTLRESVTTDDSRQIVNAIDIDDLAAERIKILERELQTTRENLQATIEELETTNEEQQATNQELLASNEELQSTNEELQSVNEELYTVNAEYQNKIQELTDINNDMDNFLASTMIGAVFLDGDLRIRKFTPEARVAINIMNQDVGRPISHISHNLRIEDLIGEIEGVMRDETSRELACQTTKGLELLVRIHPYTVQDGASDGAVVTFVDVGGLMRRDEAEASEATGETGA